MRSHRRRAPMQHVLLAGSSGEVSCMRTLLSMLPSDSYGQVLIEIAPWEELPELDAPARVCVSRVTPSDDAAGALTDAVDAWFSEWMPEEPDPRRVVGLWLGSGLSTGHWACQDLGALLLDAST